MISFLQILTLILLIPATAWGHVSTYVALEEGLYRTYEVEEIPGRLPELRRVRAYPTEALARLAAAEVTAHEFEPKSLPIPLPTEPGFLWHATESWNWAWEQKYAEWIATEVDENFFLTHGIPTDCADVAVALRWIFARNHGLPAGFHLMGAGRLFFHQDVLNEAWRALPQHADWTQDQRFQTALRYVMRLTYTHTLFQDSYPIEIKPATFLPGIHHLHLRGTTGHTQMIIRVDLADTADQAITVMSSTTPAEVRKLYPGELMVWDKADPVNNALLRIRWPEKDGQGEWELRASQTHPSYSQEQFAPDFMALGENFTDAVLRHLNPNLDYGKRLESLLKGARELWQNRVRIVEDGYQACQRQDCSPGTAAYELWSTPSRDERLRGLLEAIVKLVETKSFSRPALRVTYQTALTQNVLTLQGTPLSFEFLQQIWRGGWFDPSPTPSPAIRWGIEPQAVATKAQRGLQDELNLRQALVEKARTECNTPLDCLPLSPQWNANQTFFFEGRIDQELASLDAYRVLAPPSLAIALENALAPLTYNVAGLPLNHAELQAQAPWWSSAPEEPESVRWGSLRNNFHSGTFPVQSDQIISISRGAVAWVYRRAMLDDPSNTFITSILWSELQNPARGDLYRLPSGDRIPPPTNKIWLEYNLEHDVGIAGGEVRPGIFELDFVTAQGQLLLRETYSNAADLRVRWLDGHTLVRGASAPAPGTPEPMPGPSLPYTPEVDLYPITTTAVQNTVKKVPFRDNDPWSETRSASAWTRNNLIYTWRGDHVETFAAPELGDLSRSGVIILKHDAHTDHYLVGVSTGSPVTHITYRLWSVPARGGTPTCLMEKTGNMFGMMVASGHPYLLEFSPGGGTAAVYRWDGERALNLVHTNSALRFTRMELGVDIWGLGTPGQVDMWAFATGQPARHFSVTGAEGSLAEAGYEAWVLRTVDGTLHLRTVDNPETDLQSMPGSSGNFAIPAAPYVPLSFNFTNSVGRYLFDLDYQQAARPLFTLPTRAFDTDYNYGQSSSRILRGKLGPKFGGRMVWYEPR